MRGHGPSTHDLLFDTESVSALNDGGIKPNTASLIRTNNLRGVGLNLVSDFMHH